MMTSIQNAPGGPGILPRWTSSAKSGIGTALTSTSKVWFTVSHGIFNEIYYPSIDHACTRDLGLIVTAGQEYFSEEKRDTANITEWLAEGVPAFRLSNTCRQGRYRIEKEILADPQRSTVLQRTIFIPLTGKLADYRLYTLLAPHLANHGYGNTAWLGDYRGTPMLFAQREGNALALACSVPWLKRSAGYVGVSDGWQDLKAHNQMLWKYERAENGNVALTAEVDLAAVHGNFVLALGFGASPDEAAQCCLDSLGDGFEKARNDYIRGWQDWQKTLAPPQGTDAGGRDLARISAAVMRAHESKDFPGALIASLSIPWGFSKGDNDLGGYHLVWSRDLVETAGGFLALGDGAEARRVLHYLQERQEDDGHWGQNMWVSGAPYWNGIQLDETAFPILLVDLARREQVLSPEEAGQFWPMVRRAAGFIATQGPVTLQDRWEEDGGYSPFTLAVSTAARLAAADLADLSHESAIARYLREVADCWNDSIERWTYVCDGEWCQRLNVNGYYVRITPPDVAGAASPIQGFVPIKNRPLCQSLKPVAHIVSTGALSLVRFGLRAPDDPRILNAVKVIDALLKVETPRGPAWHRYIDDGYGEHEDGSPFDGEGVGRVWPLLVGERAHYELAAGHVREAQRLLHTMEAFASAEGLIPEQIWDSADLPYRELFHGRPSGSAMPLVWAHAEYVKLRRSLATGRVFDMPPQTVKRYLKEKTASEFFTWRFSNKCQSMPAGKKLRLELMAPATVHWSHDQWETTLDTPTHDTGLGLHVADLATDKLSPCHTVTFTFHWTQADRWEGTNFAVKVAAS